jgi:hypothetical protein
MLVFDTSPPFHPSHSFPPFLPWALVQYGFQKGLSYSNFNKPHLHLFFTCEHQDCFGHWEIGF